MGFRGVREGHFTNEVLDFEGVEDNLKTTNQEDVAAHAGRDESQLIMNANLMQMKWEQAFMFFLLRKNRYLVDHS